MKVIQLNMWMGHLMHPALQFIDEQSPDILCCQEIFHAETAHPLFDYFQLHERLSERFAYQYFSPTFSFDAGGMTAELGNAIYSQLPIENPETLFTNEAYTPYQTANSYTRNIRNIQKTNIRIADDKYLTIANHHGFHDLDPMGNEKTAEAMRKAADFLVHSSRPMILCGDLNVRPDSPALKELDVLGLRNLTAESGIATTLSAATRVKDNVACDYIFTSEQVIVNRFEASDAIVSDHKALILEFDL